MPRDWVQRLGNGYRISAGRVVARVAEAMQTCLDVVLRRLPTSAQPPAKRAGSGAIARTCRFMAFMLGVEPPPAFRRETIKHRRSLLTLCFLIVSVTVVLLHSQFRARTSAITVVFETQGRGCDDCGVGEWRVTGTRIVAEGYYTYTNIPACRRATTLAGEATKLALMLALAPTRLFIGSAIAAYDLDAVQSVLTHFSGGGWLARQLSTKGRETAECAPILVAAPKGAEHSRPITVHVRSSMPSHSSLPDDRGQWAACPVNGADSDCGAAFSRLDYVPSLRQHAHYDVWQSRYRNWYADTRGFLIANPREIRMQLHFIAPPGWMPTEEGLAELGRWLSSPRDEQDFTTTIRLPRHSAPIP